jgi:hypothetical protein
MLERFEKLRKKLKALGLSEKDIDDIISKIDSKRNKAFIEIFNDTATVITKITDSELDELIENIQNDAFEAKARLLACKEELRARKAR